MTHMEAGDNMPDNGPMGVLWIDDDGKRHYTKAPDYMWGSTTDVVNWWIRACAPTHTAPVWVFFECDTRQQLYYPADAPPFSVSTESVRHRWLMCKTNNTPPPNQKAPLTYERLL